MIVIRIRIVFLSVLAAWVEESVDPPVRAVAEEGLAEVPLLID